MNWINDMQNAIGYIEGNITENISIAEVSQSVFVSQFYFQKVFSMLCGTTIGEYIRNRRLTLAGSELQSTDAKIIDVALKYGYDSPESFSKAFTRFHGVTPSSARKPGTVLKSFAPLTIKLILEGGTIMDYKIVKKGVFTLLGAKKSFNYDTCRELIPKFWQDFYKAGNGKYVKGVFGLNIALDMKSNEFQYMIADVYCPIEDIPDGLETYTVPEFTWAVFPCKGKLPEALQSLNSKIFSEWLPNCKDYEIAAGYCIEMYREPSDYPKGTMDDNYYCEMWIPVRKK